MTANQDTNTPLLSRLTGDELIQMHHRANQKLGRARALEREALTILDALDYEDTRRRTA